MGRYNKYRTKQCTNTSWWLVLGWVTTKEYHSCIRFRNDTLHVNIELHLHLHTTFLRSGLGTWFLWTICKKPCVYSDGRTPTVLTLISSIAHGNICLLWLHLDCCGHCLSACCMRSPTAQHRMNAALQQVLEPGWLKQSAKYRSEDLPNATPVTLSDWRHRNMAI